MQVSSAILKMLSVLYVRKWLICLVFIVLGSSTAFYIHMQPPTYVASASILAKFGREYVYRQETGGNDAVTPTYSPDEVLNSLVGIMKSKDVAEEVVKQVGYKKLYPGVQQDKEQTISPYDAAVLRFMGQVSIKPDRNSNILIIEFGNGNATIAAQAVNEFMESFRTKYLSLYGEKNFDFLKGHLNLLRDQLNRAEEDLENFEHDKKAFALDTQVELLLRQRHDLDLQYKLSEAEAAGIKQRMVVLQDRIGDAVSPAKAGLDADLQQSQERRKTIEKQITEIDDQMEGMTANQRTLRNLKRERDNVQTSYAAYLRKVEEASVLRGMDANKLTSIEVIQYATPPLQPARPGKVVKIALALFFSMVTAVGVAFLTQILSRRVSSKMDIERAFDVPVLAEIPLVKA